MQVSEVTPETLPLLELGLRALARDLGDPFEVTREGLESALFSARPLCRAVLATTGGDLRGVALFSPVISTRWGRAGAYVSDLWVSPHARGAGLGPRLLSAVLGHSGAGFLKLAVYEDNPRAAKLYNRLGFRPATGETTMYLTGPAVQDLVRT